MHPDGLKIHSASLDDITSDPPPGDENPPGNGYCYSPEDVDILPSFEAEAASLFPAGKLYGNTVELREAV
jgi:hypothetical protein